MGGRKRGDTGEASRAQEWDFCFPPTLVEKYLELWIIQARGYLQQRLLLQGGYLSYEYYSYRRYGQLDQAAAVTTRTPLET